MGAACLLNVCSKKKYRPQKPWDMMLQSLPIEEVVEGDASGGLRGLQIDQSELRQIKENVLRDLFSLPSVR